jgi:hypothetical protein
MKTLILVIGLSVLSLTNGCSSPDGKETPPVTAYQTRTSEGEIMFEITPRPWKSGRLIVDIRANTHSGDLAELKLQDVAKLQVGNQAYRPVDATSLSGHHAAGTVTFEVPEAPKRFTVEMAGVRSMMDLKFEWP